MRCWLSFVGLALLGGCESQVGPGGLSRRQCSDLVRRVRQIESADTGGLQAALSAGHGSSVDACLSHANERAFRCVMQADDRDDLARCDMLFE